MYSKTLIRIKLCRIEIVPDYTGVGLGRFLCNPGSTFRKRPGSPGQALLNSY